MGCVCDGRIMQRMKRCLRRRSSGKVCPEDLPDLEEKPGEPTARSNPGTPEVFSAQSTPASTPVDGNRNPSFLFGGGLVPISFDHKPEVEEGFISISQLYNSMNDGQLSPYLYDPMYMLIIDTRCKEDYLSQHINTAIHVSELDYVMSRENLADFTMIILYDNKGLSHSLKDSTLSSIYDVMHEKKLDPFILVGGFDRFQARHPYLCSSTIARTERQRQLLIKNYPSIILEDQLFLGRGDQATNWTVVSNLGITHVVNITREHPDAFPDKLKYLRVELDDDNSSNLLRQLPNCTEFITDSINSGGKVLVHCNLGVSRSSTVTIAYLMHSRKWILRDAHDFIKDRRPIIRPNHGFVNQLSRFEEMVFGKKYTDVDRLFDICIETDSYGH